MHIAASDAQKIQQFIATTKPVIAELLDAVSEVYILQIYFDTQL